MELSRFREMFPILERLTWLATQSAAPAATPVMAALREAIDGWARGDVSWPKRDSLAQLTRERFAALIPGAGSESVALLQSLAEAAATVAGSLPAGGKIVVGSHEYRSNFFPWLTAGRWGIRVEEVAMTQGALPSATLVDAIDEETSLVAVSVVQSWTGYRTDLTAVADACARVGARLFLDATQSAGVLRIPPRVDPDYVAAHGYKWLLCPRGAAWLYVRPDRLAELHPLAPNHKSTRRPWSEFYGGPLELAPDARKLDMSLGWPSWAGAAAALQLLGELDPDEVEAHCLGLAGILRQGAQDRGLTCVPAELPSHIVGIRLHDCDRRVSVLADRGIRVTGRQRVLRAGVHAFNTVEDVERTLDALDSSEPDHIST